MKNPRVRAIATTDPDDALLEGGTAHLIAKDPFLAYQLGRNINMREFRPRDGIFSEVVSGFGGPMVDGTTAKITSNNQTSCLGCHNLPSGTPGGGTNFAKDSGFGRNAPHYFGAGIMEMLAIQNRRGADGPTSTQNGRRLGLASGEAAEFTVQSDMVEADPWRHRR